MKKLFGTDGIRGLANQYPMTIDMVQRLGSAAALFFKKRNQKTKIVIGKDTRLSNYMFETALTSGINAMGVDVVWIGPLPTPAISHLTQSLRADAGIMISASHNPYYDNGIKFFGPDGVKLGDAIEMQLENLVIENKFNYSEIQYDKIGRLYRIDQGMGRYIEYLKGTFPKYLKLDGLRIGLDCANGAAYRIAPIVLEELGAKVFVIGDKPNGININENIGALHTKELRKLVIEHDLDIGIALDGDADRVIFIDKMGNEVNGDSILGVLAKELIKTNKLQNKTLVTTVMSNMGLDKAIESIGGKIVKTKVGDRYVIEGLIKHQSNLGGENSGHIIFTEHSKTGDGMLAALQMLAIMIKNNTTIDELVKFVKIYPQVLKSIPIRNKTPFEKIPEIKKRIAEIEKELNDTGRILVRYSGTENKARIMIEGDNYNKISVYADELAELFQKFL
jgi:phosphoglucosamine mutase